MARTKSTRIGTAKIRRRPARTGDAITLLKSDHRQVKAWFAQFEQACDDDRKLELATRICAALKVHTRIEEEIFYPALLGATGDKPLHHEAVVEHESAQRLIADIEASSPADDFFDARVKVLAEMIRHHVDEEERADGMFAKARGTAMNLQLLGERMRERKQQLAGHGSVMPAAVRRGKDGILGRILEFASR